MALTEIGIFEKLFCRRAWALLVQVLVDETCDQLHVYLKYIGTHDRCLFRKGSVTLVNSRECGTSRRHMTTAQATTATAYTFRLYLLLLPGLAAALATPRPLSSLSHTHQQQNQRVCIIGGTTEQKQALTSFSSLRFSSCSKND
jgi:hypothetical protein